MPEIDDYTLNPDGTVDFDLGGIQRHLKRPTLGQYRTLVEALADEGEHGENDSAIKIRIDQMVTWLDKVCIELAGEGLPRTEIPDPAPKAKAGATITVIDEDKLPAWISSQALPTDLVLQWQTIPNHRGGQ